MNKKYFFREVSSIALQSGNCGIMNLHPTNAIQTEFDSLITTQELLGVHQAKLLVRLSATDAHQDSFGGIIIAFLSDGAVTNNTPLNTVDDLGQVNTLIELFATSGHVSHKMLGEPKVSGPIKAYDGSSTVHQITFVFDVKKIIKEWAKLYDDALETENYVMGFAAVIQGYTGVTYHGSAYLYIEYSKHDRPMKTFMKKTL